MAPSPRPGHRQGQPRFTKATGRNPEAVAQALSVSRCAWQRYTPTDTTCERPAMTTSLSGRATPGRPPRTDHQRERNHPLWALIGRECAPRLPRSSDTAPANLGTRAGARQEAVQLAADGVDGGVYGLTMNRSRMMTHAPHHSAIVMALA